MDEGKNKEDILVSCVYFDQPGPHNTQQTLRVASQRAEELDVSNILVASTSGKTGLEALHYFWKRNLVVVTHSTGFRRPDDQQLKPQNKEKLKEAGVGILTCQHAFGGVGRAVRKKLGTYELEEIVAYTLRNFGEGTKVSIEIALMAADSGFISTQKPCISIGGTGRGVDTALLLKPAHAQNFFDLKVMEFLAKPRFSVKG